MALAGSLAALGAVVAMRLHPLEAPATLVPPMIVVGLGVGLTSATPQSPCHVK